MARPTASRRATLGAGLGTALAVSLPLALLAQILDAVTDDDLPTAVTVALAVLIMVGPLLGGLVVGRREPGRARWPLAFLVGVVGLGLVAILGALRTAADDDATGGLVGTVVALALWGGVLALVGAAAGRGGAARTRP